MKLLRNLLGLQLLLTAVILFHLCFPMYRIETGSMEPLYPVGSLVLVSRLAEPEALDVYAYQHGSHVIVHRIVAREGPDFRFRGDANNVSDPYPVSETELIGEVVLCIPPLTKCSDLLS